MRTESFSLSMQMRLGQVALLVVQCDLWKARRGERRIPVTSPSCLQPEGITAARASRVLTAGRGNNPGALSSTHTVP